MTTKHRCRMLFVWICIFSALPALSKDVTYQETGVVTGTFDPAGLPAPFSSAAIGQTLTIDFTVNTKDPGVLNAPGNEAYQGAVVSVSATLGSGSSAIETGSNALSGTNQIGIFNNFLDGGKYLTQYQVDTLGNILSNFTGEVSRFDLITGASSSQPLALYKNTSLRNAPLGESLATATGGDQMDLVFYSVVNGAIESSSAIVVGTGVRTERIRTRPTSVPEIGSASAASGLTLLLGAVLVLCGTRRRGDSHPPGHPPRLFYLGRSEANARQREQRLFRVEPSEYLARGTESDEHELPAIRHL